jgi:hypothetical protein
LIPIVTRTHACRLLHYCTLGLVSEATTEAEARMYINTPETDAVGSISPSLLADVLPAMVLIQARLVSPRKVLV